MSSCQPSPRRSIFAAFFNSGRYLTIAAAIGLMANVSGCGGHSSTPVDTAGYAFTNFDFTNTTGGTMPTAINNNGVLVGYTAAASPPYTNFFRNADGSFATLAVTDGGASVSNHVTANGLNDADLVVGAIVGSGGSTAFEASNPVTSAAAAILPPVASTQTTTQAALGVNDGGMVVGQYFDANTGNTPGFLYASNTGASTIIDPAPAFALSSGITFAQGINKNGIVIGSYATNGSTFQHGFAYSLSTGQYTALPDPSTARITSTNTLASVRFMAINDDNEAAGYYQTSNGSQYAFVFDLATLTYTFLDDPSAVQAAAHDNMQSTRITGINNAATICGTYTDGNYVTHAFIATLH